MYVQTRHLIILFHIFHTIWSTSAELFFENNACSDFSSYLLSPFAFSKRCYYNPDVSSNVIEMVERNGYTVISHEVTTDDGYILTMFRIASKNVTMKNPPVFIQHGILTNSGPWVDKKDRSLAFQIADMGYDVWLGNSRGTTYSRKHVSLKVSSAQFWEYNLDTMASHDIRSQLNFIANNTGNRGDIIYIGHSQGTTLGFMYCSEFPNEAQSLLQGLVALAPVVYLDTIKVISLLRPLALAVINVLDSLNIKGILYREEFIHEGLNKICRIIPDICYLPLHTVFGKTTQFLPDDLLLYYSYWPTGTSIFQLKQFLQINKSGRFQKFDYGKEKNKQIYGTTEPPLYNLTNIKIPTYLFHGRTDPLYTQESLHKLYNEIGSFKKILQPVPLSENFSAFNHIDFLYAKDLKNLLYKGVFDILNTEFGKGELD